MYFLREILPLYVVGAVAFAVIMPRVVRHFHGEE